MITSLKPVLDGTVGIAELATDSRRYTYYGMSVAREKKVPKWHWKWRRVPTRFRGRCNLILPILISHKAPRPRDRTEPDLCSYLDLSAIVRFGHLTRMDQLVYAISADHAP